MTWQHDIHDTGSKLPWVNMIALAQLYDDGGLVCKLKELLGWALGRKKQADQRVELLYGRQLEYVYTHDM
ncbi:unnamed protein product [Urochloa humidicola]